MWTFLKYVFYILVLVALFYIGKAFYDSNWGNQASETVVVSTN